VNGKGFVVGVDGGNSKTDVVVADLTGRVLSRARGVGTQSPIGDAESAAAALASLVGVAKRAAGLDDVASAAVFYLANLDLADEEDVLSLALEPHAIASRMAFGNDTLAVLRAGTDQGWGVAVVLGTGINAIAMSPSGQIERFLGIGPESGDWGGGRGLAIAGVGGAVRAEDGRGPATTLAQVLPAHFGFATAHELAVAIRRMTVPRARVLELTPLVLAAADDGDAVAESLIVRQGDEVATMAVALLRRIGRLNEETPLILGGGVAQGGSRLLLDTIRERLADAAPLAYIKVLDLPPVAGAVAAALDLAEADRTAVHTVRAYNW